MFYLRSTATCLILATVNDVTPRWGVALAVTMIDLATMDCTDAANCPLIQRDPILRQDFDSPQRGVAIVSYNSFIQLQHRTGFSRK